MQLRIADVASYAPRNAAAAAYPEVASVDNSRCECVLHTSSRWPAKTCLRLTHSLHAVI